MRDVPHTSAATTAAVGAAVWVNVRCHGAKWCSCAGTIGGGPQQEGPRRRAGGGHEKKQMEVGMKKSTQCSKDNNEGKKAHDTKPARQHVLCRRLRVVPATVGCR